VFVVVLQVNLSQCTKPVDPTLKPLCEQDVYLNENPEKVYQKLLCCDTCAIRTSEGRNLLPVYLSVVFTSVFAMVLMIVICVLASKYRAARNYVREIQEGNAASLYLLLASPICTLQVYHRSHLFVCFGLHECRTSYVMSALEARMYYPGFGFVFRFCEGIHINQPVHVQGAEKCDS
jgi:hypothetical protein